jgi:signal transduction histidine kinase
MLVIPIVLSSAVFALIPAIYMAVTGTRRPDVYFESDWGRMKAYYAWIGLMYVFLIAVIVVTNRILTRFVFRNVANPIDTLTHGVQQIRDGNLDYRIQYDRKDEFTGICSDFNDMAQRLSDSVERRQRDDDNRKELIAGISHDLRTPLTVVKAYVEGLENGVAMTPEVQVKYLATIRSKADDLERIINQLFMFSKIDIGEFPFDLGPISVDEELHRLIDSVTEDYEARGLTLSLATDCETAVVNADVQQFRNAITNIMENALTYKTAEQGKLQIATHMDSEHVTVELVDDGPGVPPGDIDKLFTVFYRADPARSSKKSGSGLGLAITSKIMARMGGGIQAHNAPEGGLAMVITLPIAAGDSAS